MLQRKTQWFLPFVVENYEKYRCCFTWIELCLRSQLWKMPAMNLSSWKPVPIRRSGHFFCGHGCWGLLGGLSCKVIFGVIPNDRVIGYTMVPYGFIWYHGSRIPKKLKLCRVGFVIASLLFEELQLAWFPGTCLQLRVILQVPLTFSNLWLLIVASDCN